MSGCREVALHDDTLLSRGRGSGALAQQSH
jgi:hypothetical protein